MSNLLDFFDLSGHILTEEDEERNFVWQRKFLVYYISTTEGKESLDINKYASYVDGCIDAPHLLTDPAEIDLFIKLVIRNILLRNTYKSGMESKFFNSIFDESY